MRLAKPANAAAGANPLAAKGYTLDPWEIWSFAPDFLPTGEELFQCGAVANSGGYCDPANDGLISETLTSGNLSYMYQWQDYLATQLPVLWQPNADYQLTEVADNLKGVTPQSPTLDITAENWYFVR
jgi:peptide/nickel transport system substrate-binding protein